LGRALALGALLGAAGPAAGQDVGIAVGEKAQAVVIEDLAGAPVDLGDVIGKKPVLFEFWATWCPLCRALEPRIEAVKKQYGDGLEVVFVAVAVNQTKRSIQRHLDGHPMPGRMLWDTDGRAVRALKAPSTSYIVVLDAEGRVAYTGVGDEQDIGAAVAKAIR
jgi:thiol-disulfide isomerase/thioredoxin